MTFNVWGGGASAGRSIDETVALLRAVGADLVGLQETRVESEGCRAEDCPPAGESVAPALATALGLHSYEQTADNEALWAKAKLRSS